MMKRWVVEGTVGVALTLGLTASPLAAQQKGHNPDHAGVKTAKALPACPVTGEPINFAVSVAADEGPVFFCCADCIKKYEANPTKYATQLAAQRKLLAKRDKVQVTCPVTGETVDPKVFVESGGRKVYFCCKGCIKKFQKDPASYKVALANSFTYQTTCPVTGEEIDPQTNATLVNGHKIYFCCPGCDKKFFQKPFKYAPALAAQGYAISPAQMKHGKAIEDQEEHD